MGILGVMQGAGLIPILLAQISPWYYCHIIWRITLVLVIKLAWQSSSTIAVMGLALAGIEGIYAD